LVLLSVMGGALACLLVWGQPAGGQEPAGSTTTTEAEQPAGDVFEIQIIVVDRKGTREGDDDEPLDGVNVDITGADGDFEETVETDDEGRAEAALPLGTTYTVELDADSLPDGYDEAEGGNSRQVDPASPNRSRIVAFNFGGRERAVTGTFERFAQRFADGVNFGLLIAICAVGLSLIYGTTGLTNFAHGEMVTFGAITAYVFNQGFGMPILIAAPIAIAIGAGLGYILDKGLWKPLRRRGVGLFAMMVISIGLAFLLRHVFLFGFGGDSRPLRIRRQDAIDFGPFALTPRTLISIALCVLVLLGVAVVLQYTRIGKAMRAVADNPDLAASSGINVEGVILFVWVMGAALAALGGILFAADQQVNFRFGFELLLLMFAGITLGGLGTAYGALLGCFLVGLLIQVSTMWVPFELKNVGALAVLIIVLLVRPQGILGRAERVG
jgi:branched-chain amino acid transport system permease protein